MFLQYHDDDDDHTSLLPSHLHFFWAIFFVLLGCFVTLSSRHPSRGVFVGPLALVWWPQSSSIPSTSCLSHSFRMTPLTSNIGVPPGCFGGSARGFPSTWWLASIRFRWQRSAYLSKSLEHYSGSHLPLSPSDDRRLPPPTAVAEVAVSARVAGSLSQLLVLLPLVGNRWRRGRRRGAGVAILFFVEFWLWPDASYVFCLLSSSHFYPAVLISSLETLGRCIVPPLVLTTCRRSILTWHHWGRQVGVEEVEGRAGSDMPPPSRVYCYELTVRGVSHECVRREQGCKRECGIVTRKLPKSRIHCYEFTQ
ncbi:hypothetical protein BJY52DRAFT_1230248 [Lactarius psammicola]|nr:hypothetical protein BJY52DRAFT_1230248 [Lactarius psammicola]